MRTAETIAGLARFKGRGAGTDAERRAAGWLANELGDSRLEVRIEPFWCRPNWALAHAWHMALALAGSLLAVSAPRVGGALILVALLSLIADVVLGISPGRRLTPERASQNLLAAPPDTASDKWTRLIITANYDAGRTGLVYRDWPRAAAARLRTLTGGIGPGWLGWLAIAMTWLLVIAILRLQGDKGSILGVAQLIPTIALVLALALLLDLATSDYGPAAGENASGVAVALALFRALDAAPPRHLAVELVLQGAGEGTGIGLRRYLRARKRTLKPTNAVVVGVAACTEGMPRWWVSDGALLPVRYFPRLGELCATIAAQEPELGAKPHRGRGTSPALAARIAQLPAIAIGCLDDRGLVPRSHQPGDTADAVDADAADRAATLGLLLVDAIDGYLSTAASAASTAVPSRI